MSDLTTRLRELDGLQLNERHCWTIKETATHLVEVIPMIFNDRLVLTPKAAPEVYDYGWCYDQGGPAILAALAWDPATEAEPVGFKERATPNERVLAEQEGSDHA